VSKLSKKFFRVKNKEKKVYIWTVFVQILLPLTLIITFLANINYFYFVSTIFMYKLTSKHEEENFANCIEKFEKAENGDPVNLYMRINIKKNEIQLLKLKLEFEKVKNNLIDQYNINYFKNSENYVNSEIILKNNSFITLCDYANKKFQDIENEQVLKNELFDNLLLKLNIYDCDEQTIERNYNMSEETFSSLNNTSNMITCKNKKIIKDDIKGFVKTIKEFVIQLQIRVFLDILFQTIDNYPLNDEQISIMIDKFGNEKNETYLNKYAKDTHEIFVNAAKNKVTKFSFLREVFSRVTSLEMMNN